METWLLSYDGGRLVNLLEITFPVLVTDLSQPWIFLVATNHSDQNNQMQVYAQKTDLNKVPQITVNWVILKTIIQLLSYCTK